MTQPFLSIIIPTYNSGNIVRVAMDSIAAQTFRNFEVLVMDGASTDDTLQVAGSYTNMNVRILSEKDNGIYDAMNKGIKHAKGEWLYFLGSDDKFSHEDVLTQMTASIEDGTGIIYGNSLWQPEGKMEKGEWNHHRLLQQSINHQRIFYRATLFNEFGDFNTNYKVAADYELNIRFFCKPRVIKKYVDLLVADYHSGGFSANRTDEPFWDNWKIIYLGNFSAHLPKKDIYERLNGYCWYCLEKKQYKKAAALFFTIFFHTGDLRFVKYTITKGFKSLKR